MPELREQIAAYLDTVVERVDVEDVAAQVGVRDRGEAGVPVRARWAWAFAGAGVVFAVIGAVALAEWAVRPGIRPFASAGGAAGGAAPGPGWVLAAGAVGGAALVGGSLVVATALRERSWKRREQTMQTLERKPREAAARPSRWPTIALIVLLVMGVGLGTWWLVDEYTGVDREIELLLEDYSAAWTAGDGEAALALMTSTGRHYSVMASQGVSGEELAAFVRTLHGRYGARFEPTGDPVIVESGISYLVMQPGRISSDGEDPDLGFSYYRVIRTDGELRIARHEWFS